MKMDKTVFQVVDMNDTKSDIEYWLSKTPEERLQTLFFLRQQVYGKSYIRKGLQRVLSIVKR